ncbi:serine/threonine-protein kinase [Polyangium sp. y55x31]|uniref:serine/threonine protein kinase n=1 Tax=Polyangium sp. y55x31 TaxID=3042688 RepID=UPI002482ED8E|nr:serine/threonine-protein kinase [Polyangium sp. y55x31]MDI1480664.1 serine/threonine-protein kinase [Polyangium sp. y55x31]
MDEHELERRVGTVLCGKWTLERLLGSGGMAAVYVAVHKIGRRDAIKILHPEIARVPELRARFDQEARAVNQFVHPGAVEIRDVDTTEDGCPFLVMELLEGESLAARARRGRMDISEILRIIDELLDVLAAAHAHGIVHRDIKPDNLFCLRDGRLKVLDFGVARVRQAANSVHTRTGTTLGTIAYMPPEQIAGKDVDARADVFAVGATMFRLITRRRIHEAHSDSELLIKMSSLPAPSLASVAPETPQAVCAIVDRALAFERDKRYPSARAMLQDIRAVRAGQPLAIPQQVVIAAASTHPDEAIGTDKTVAAPHAAAAGAGQGLVPSSAASARAGSAVAPTPAPSSTASVFTQATQWTVTTVRGRRLRWAALAFPLLGAGVLALVYYRAVHVDSDARPPASSRALGPLASSPTRSPAGTRSTAAVVDPSLAKTGGDKPRLPSQAPRGSGQGAGALPHTNCMTTNACDYVCDDACEVSCKDPRGCEIGARRDALVDCTGSLTCKVSCEGDCVINCIEGTPCLVHCTPGSRCVFGACPQQTETCAGDITVCGAKCPE